MSLSLVDPTDISADGECYCDTCLETMKRSREKMEKQAPYVADAEKIDETNNSKPEQMPATPTDLVAIRDQRIAEYNEHGTALVELRQRLAQVEAGRLRLEGAIATLSELLGEAPAGG